MTVSSVCLNMSELSQLSNCPTLTTFHPLCRTTSLALSSFIIYWNIGTFETSSQIRKTNKINVNNGHHQQNAKSTTLHVLRSERERGRGLSGKGKGRAGESECAVYFQIQLYSNRYEYGYRESGREREGLTRGTFAQTVARQRLKLCVHVCVCLYKYNKKRLKNNNNNKQQQQ